MPRRVHPGQASGPIGATKDFLGCNSQNLNPWQRQQCRAKAVGCFAASAAAGGICGGIGMIGGPGVAAAAGLACGTVASQACDKYVQIPGQTNP